LITKRAGVGDQAHAEGDLVEPRGLGGVAGDEHDGIHGPDSERVGRDVVIHEADEPAQLVIVDIIEAAGHA